MLGVLHMQETRGKKFLLLLVPVREEGATAEFYFCVLKSLHTYLCWANLC